MSKLFRRKHANEIDLNLEKTNIYGLYPLKDSFCPCGSRKKYKKCCQKKEVTPFSPLDKGIEVTSDEKLFALEDENDTHILQCCSSNLNKGNVQLSLEVLEKLQKKYPKKTVIGFLIAAAHKLNQDFPSLQKMLNLLIGSSFLPVKLLRWWHICEWESERQYFPSKNFNSLTQITSIRKSFYLTEFCLWGIIRILEALYKERFIEAEAHFICLNQVAERKGVSNHWVLKEGLKTLESAYYLRRLKILGKGGEIEQKRDYSLFSSS